MKYVGRIVLSTLLLVLAVAMTACGQQDYSTSALPEASGRFATVTNEYPGVVMVLSPGGRGMCTGTIVAPNAVLTATHCLQDGGTYTVRTNHGDYKTSHVESHGTGDVDDPNDIGFLIFDFALTTDASEIYPLANKIQKGDAVAIVGFGCNSVEKRSGSGFKRAGTNRLAEKDDYLVLLTPKAGNTAQAASPSRGIIGDTNQAGTCFGDSGGPMFKVSNGQLSVAGVTHAGGVYSTYYVSEFSNVADNSSNRGFISDLKRSQGLAIDGI